MVAAVAVEEAVDFVGFVRLISYAATIIQISHAWDDLHTIE